MRDLVRGKAVRPDIVDQPGKPCSNSDRFLLHTFGWTASLGSVEIVCGTLVILGLFTRIAVVPLLGVMAVAFVTTKLPILLGQDLGPFQVRQLPYCGFWGFAHEFLLLAGPGRLSLDERRTRRQ